jgi:hypothetical protein
MIRSHEEGRMRMSRIRKALIVGAIAATGAVAAPAAAHAGIYTWQYVATYPTLTACQAAGPGAQAAQDADTWRCTTTTSGAKLYVGFIW